MDEQESSCVSSVKTSNWKRDRKYDAFRERKRSLMIWFMHVSPLGEAHNKWLSSCYMPFRSGWLALTQSVYVKRYGLTFSATSVKLSMCFMPGHRHPGR